MSKRMRIIALSVFIFLQVFLLQAVDGKKALAEDFRLPELSGRFYQLSDYKEKQAVLLFFWTTWCPYCQVELKSLSGRAEALAAEGLQVLAINVGETKARVEKFKQSRNLQIKILLDEDSSVTNAFGVLGVPTFCLIDKHGRVVSQEHTFPANYKNLMQ